ncbi:MAG: hypothetical protein ACI8XB_002436 [Patiriisocius sp.]|jgi:hypothetical protein
MSTYWTKRLIEQVNELAGRIKLIDFRIDRLITNHL